MTTKWVLIDQSSGAKTSDGSSLDHAALVRIASCCDAQMNNEFSQFYGGSYQIRAGENPTDILPGEQVCLFVPTLEQAPGASAFHDTDGNGVPVAYCAVTTCGSLFGPTGISVDTSHEILEAGADPSCNLMADNFHGLLIAYEVSDPVEVQTYTSPVDKDVQVSNFVLPSWFDPKASAPYDFMSHANLPGAVAPPAPLQLAPGDGGNYIITESSNENSSDTFGIRGKRRKERGDTASRYMRRLMGRQISHKGKMQVATPQVVNLTIEAPKIDDTGAPVLPLTSTAERVKAPTPAFEPGIRQQTRTLPVSLQRRTALGGPVTLPNDSTVTVLSDPSKQAIRAAEQYLTRKEHRAKQVRGMSTGGQIDQQRKVLAGRRDLRKKPDEK
jgi:hypothetical protein